jgi:regulatory protein
VLSKRFESQIVQYQKGIMEPTPPDRTPGAKIKYRNAMNTAVRLLTRRQHTCRELARKLGSRGVDGDTVAEVIAACEGLGYLNDAEAARVYINELKNKGYGYRHVRFAMQKKGFDGALVEDALSAHYLPAEEAQAALRMALKKQRSLGKRKAGRELRENVYRFLYARGFSSDATRRALRETFSDG